MADSPASLSAASCTPIAAADGARFKIIGAISFAHFLNDMMQSLILAIYPLLKGTFALSFAQIGLITLTYQITASLLQPVVGLYTDRHPKSYSLAVGMGFTLVGLLTLAVAPSFAVLLIASALVGTGSSVFHPRHRALRAWHRAASMGLPSRYFRLAAMPAARLARCWRRGLLFRTARAPLPGFHWRHCWRFLFSCKSRAGINMRSCGRYKLAGRN